MYFTSMQVVNAVKPSAIFVAVQNWLPTISYSTSTSRYIQDFQVHTVNNPSLQCCELDDNNQFRKEHNVTRMRLTTKD